jgi:hypothetical protein
VGHKPDLHGTGYQANQSSLNQAHNLSLLALTIQADALKKRSIQSDASAWIGLIVDNYVRDTSCKQTLVAAIQKVATTA